MAVRNSRRRRHTIESNPKFFDELSESMSDLSTLPDPPSNQASNGLSDITNVPPAPVPAPAVKRSCPPAIAQMQRVKYDQSIMADLVWMYTAGGESCDEVGAEITSLTSYPLQAMPPPTEGPIAEMSKSAKRSLIMTLEPYMKVTSVAKKEEVQELEAATRVKCLKNPSGGYHYEDTTYGKPLDADEYGRRYSQFVDQRRRILSEQLSTSGWFTEARPHRAEATSRSTDGEASPLRRPGPTDISRFTTTPPTSVSMSRGRKTLSPTEIMRHMDHEKRGEGEGSDGGGEGSGGGDGSGDEAACEAAEDTAGPAVAEMAEAERLRLEFETSVAAAETELHEAWFDALNRYHEEKAFAEEKLAAQLAKLVPSE